MGLTVAVYHFLANNTIKRIPMTHWNPISRGDTAYVGFENQTIKIAYAYIERMNRKPVYCALTEGVIYRTDAEGFVDFYEKMHDAGSPLEDLPIFDEYNDPDVINQRAMFRKKFYMNRHRWQLTPKDVQKIVEAVF